VRAFGPVATQKEAGMTYVEEVFEHRRWDWITTEAPADEPDLSGDSDAGSDNGGDPGEREA
jgi:hypothetical protein